MKIIHATQSPWVVQTDDGPMICVMAKVAGQQIEVRGLIDNPVYFTEQVIERVLKPEVKKMRADILATM